MLINEPHSTSFKFIPGFSDIYYSVSYSPLFVALTIDKGKDILI
jgi:hypothetical protein